MTPIELFWWFIQERELVRIKKSSGHFPPWTQDKRLATYRFQNVDRLDDPSTSWLKSNVLDQQRDRNKLLQAVIMFRLLTPAPGAKSACASLLPIWQRDGFDEEQCLRVLGPIWRGKPDTAAIVGSLLDLQDKPYILESLASGRMEAAHNRLQLIKGIGATVAYRIVCDLRHTSWLHNAKDIRSWAAPTDPVCKAVGQLLGYKMRGSREKDREAALSMMKHLRPDNWEMSRIHRALCLFESWLRVTAPRRYDGNNPR